MDFFDTIFFKPQVLIEIRRLGMFLMILDHLRPPIPPLEHGGTSTSGLEITVFSRKYVDIIVFRTISDEYTCEH